MNRNQQLTATFPLKFSRSEKARNRNPENDRHYVVPVLLKAVSILDTVKSSHEALRVQDIERVTGISRSTIYRILRTFIVSGHLQEVRSGRYVISPTLNPHPSR